MGALARLHVHLRPQVAHGADDLHQALHLPGFLGEVVFGLDLGPTSQDQHAVMLRQVLVHFLGQEGHEGMQQLQQALQHVQQHRAHILLLLLVLAHQAALAQLDIPVAELAPREVVYILGRDAEIAVLHVGGHLGDGAVQAGKNPLIGQKQLGGVDGFPGLGVHQHEAGGVPDLVGEVPGAFHLFIGIAGVVSGADAHGQREAQRVRAVLIDDFQRIHAVAQALGHLAALRVPHQAVNQHGVEGRLAHLLDAGEDHSGYPEEDDVIAGHQHTGGIEVLQILGVMGPAQRGEGPQGGGEPGVQHVLVLMEMGAAALGALFGRVLADHGLAALVAVIGGNPMAPPQLTADAPVANVLHPVEIGLGEPFRHELHLARAHRLDGGPGQRLHLHEPLSAGHRVYRMVAAVAGAHVVGVVLDLHHQAQLLQLLHHGFAAFHGRHALELARIAVHGAVVVGDADDLQIVALAHLKVVGVVSGGHLHRAGAELHVHIIVGHHGDLPVHQRQNDLFAHQIGVALVVGVHGHAGIAQHGFGTGSCHDHALAAVRAGVADVPQMAGLLLIFHFRVGQGGLALGAPVDDTVAAVDQAFFVQAHEHLAHGLIAALVHGEALPAPVAASAQTALLAVDASAVLLFPCPCPLQKAFAAYHFLSQTFLGHGVHHLHLGGDGGVVGAGQPQGGVALHAVVTNGRVLQKTVHSMAHVQLAGNIGRRHHDGKGLLALHTVRHERAAFLPHFVEFILDLLRIVHLFHGEFLILSHVLPSFLLGCCPGRGIVQAKAAMFPIHCHVLACVFEGMRVRRIFQSEPCGT